MSSPAAKRIDNRARQNEALALRRRGMTWQEVADEAGYSDRQGARRAVLTLLDRVEVEDVEDYRAEELGHLQQAQVKATANVDRAIDAEDLPAVNGAIRLLISLSERRSKLLGLNAPDRIDVGAADADLEAVLARAVALMDRTGAEVTE